MKNIIYLKNLGDIAENLDNGITKFTSKFSVEFNNAYKGLKEQYGSRVLKFLKVSLIDTFKDGTFTITKYSKCADGDDYDFSVGEKIARTKVEIAACDISSKLLEKLKDMMMSDTFLIDDQAIDVEIRKACEAGYYVNKKLQK